MSTAALMCLERPQEQLMGGLARALLKQICLHIYRPGKPFHACMTEVAHRCTF